MCEVWLQQRLMFIGALVVFFCALGLAALKHWGHVSAGMGGLALAYSLNVVINMNMVVRNAADVEAYIYIYNNTWAPRSPSPQP